MDTMKLDKQEKTEGMLASYRILDLTDEKGLMCGQLLGSLGADVIKVERPGGDLARNIGPFFHDIPSPEKSLFWFAFNTNKRGITLNIEAVDGREIFGKLVGGANVVIESFPPGYMDKMGLGYSELEKINRGIIMTSITPFGQTGPYKNLKASDLVCWAIGGALFTCGSFGRPPVRVSHVPQSFLVASTDAAWGTMMALYWRRISGEGQHVDVSIQESVERVALSSHVVWRSTGSSFQQRGSNYSVLPVRPEAPRTMWSCKDGYVACHIFAGEMGANLNPPIIEWMSSEGQADEYLTGIDWAKFEWDNITKEELERIEGYYERFFKTKTRAELLEGAKQRRAMVQPVYGATNLLEHPQLEARGYWQELEHPELGITIRYPGGFCRPSDTVCKAWRRAPLIGEHNLEVYHQELGFSKEELTILKQGGII
jgi:crotonobetainyl-CoA:carnitine CoA-transferase CaiB-like acyl-CoA transferase